VRHSVSSHCASEEVGEYGDAEVLLFWLATFDVIREEKPVVD